VSCAFFFVRRFSCVVTVQDETIDDESYHNSDLRTPSWSPKRTNNVQNRAWMMTVSTFTELAGCRSVTLPPIGHPPVLEKTCASAVATNSRLNHKTSVAGFKKKFRFGASINESRALAQAAGATSLGTRS
jgi:hypothetical protein